MPQKVIQMSSSRSLRMQYRNTTWGVGPGFRSHQRIDERTHRTQFAEPKERPIVCPRVCAPRILPDPIEPYPRIRIKCVQRGSSPDNPETPERMTNALGTNMEHFIQFYRSKVPCVITHMRAGQGMTWKESRNAPCAKTRVAHDSLYPGRQSNSTTQRIARRESEAENSLRRSKVADTMHRFRHDRIRT